VDGLRQVDIGKNPRDLVVVGAHVSLSHRTPGGDGVGGSRTRGG
jgi:hypothetical protein